MPRQDNAWAPVFDAGMALQREMITSTRSAMESGIALQRALIRTAEQTVRATDPTLWMPREVAERNLSVMIGAAPGVSRETADRVADEIISGAEETNPLIGRPLREMRDAALRTMQDAEEFLEETSRAAEQGFDEIAESMRRVSEESREAMDRATRAMVEVGEATGRAAREAAKEKSEPKAARRGGRSKPKSKGKAR